MADGDSQHAAPGASPVMGPATNNIILTTEMHAAPVARATTSGLDQEVRAPQTLTSAAGMWTQLTSTTWHVSCHVPLDSFLHFNGPAVITRYNMNFCRRKQWPELATRTAYEPSNKYSAADTLALTPLGRATLLQEPSRRVWRWELACSGAAAHGKEPPNPARRRRRRRRPWGQQRRPWRGERVRSSAMQGRDAGCSLQ